MENYEMQIVFKDFNEDKQIINEYIHFWFRENYIENGWFCFIQNQPSHLFINIK